MPFALVETQPWSPAAGIEGHDSPAGHSTPIVRLVQAPQRRRRRVRMRESGSVCCEQHKRPGTSRDCSHEERLTASLGSDQQVIPQVCWLPARHVRGLLCRFFWSRTDFSRGLPQDTRRPPQVTRLWKRWPGCLRPLFHASSRLMPFDTCRGASGITSSVQCARDLRPHHDGLKERRSHMSALAQCGSRGFW